MKKKILLLMTLATMGLTAKTMAQNFNLNWVKNIGNSSTTSPKINIEKDVQGNIYVSGGFIGTVDFDPGSGVFNLTSQNTTYGDNYLLKLDQNGNFLWVKQWNFNPTNNSFYSGNSGNSGFEFKVTPLGIFITGAFTGTTDFNPSNGVNNMSANGTSSWDAYFLKLDLNGNYMWAQCYGGSSSDWSRNVAFDSNDNIYLIGYFSGTSDFNFSSATNNLTSNGAADVFILKLDPNGNFIWVKKIGGTTNDDFINIEIDTQNNIYYGGGYYTSSTIDMDPGAGTFTLNATPNNWGIALGKLDANGNFLWAVNIATSGQNVGFMKLNTLSNQIFLVGSFNSSLDIDPGASVNNIVSNGADDIFLLSLNSSGNYVWSTSFGGAGVDNLNSYHPLNFDSNGRILLTGSFTQTVDFDPGISNNLFTSSGLKDIFLTVFSSTGNYITTKTFGSIGDDNGASITTVSPDLVYLTGTYSNTVDFDPNQGVSNLTSAGLLDNYILKLNSSFCGYTIYDTVTVYNTITVYDTITTYVTVTDTLIINATITGLNPPINQNTLKIYPNPSKTHITIDYGNYSSMIGYTLKIVNSFGQNVFTTSINQQTSYINLSNWTGNGIYFVQLIDTQNNTIENRKIVIQ